jgi:hypothetical protein
MAAYPDFAIAKLPDAYARLDFVLIDPAQAVMKFGDIRKLGGRLRFRITPAIWQRELCEPYYEKQEFL